MDSSHPRGVSFDSECILIPEVVISTRPRLTVRKYSLSSSRPSPFADDPSFTPSPPSATSNLLKSLSLPIPRITRAPSRPSMSRSNSNRSTDSEGEGLGMGFGGLGLRNRRGSGSRERERGVGVGEGNGLVGILKKPREEKEENVDHGHVHGWINSLATVKETNSGTATPINLEAEELASSSTTKTNPPTSISRETESNGSLKSSNSSSASASNVFKKLSNQINMLEGCNVKPYYSDETTPGSKSSNTPSRPGLKERTSSLLTRVRSRESTASPISPSSPAPSLSRSRSLSQSISRTTSRTSNTQTTNNNESSSSSSPTTTNQAQTIPLSSCCRTCLQSTSHGLEPDSQWQITFSPSAKRKMEREKMEKEKGIRMRTVLLGNGKGGVGIAGGGQCFLDGIGKETGNGMGGVEKEKDGGLKGGRNGKGEKKEDEVGEEESDDGIEEGLTELIKKHVVIDEVERDKRRRGSEASLAERSGEEEDEEEERSTNHKEMVTSSSHKILSSSPSTSTSGPQELVLTPEESEFVDRLPDPSYFQSRPSTGRASSMPMVHSSAGAGGGSGGKAGRFGWFNMGGSEATAKF